MVAVSSGGDSKQDYQTPADFIRAVEKRFGPISFDLAAHAGNHLVDRYFAPRILTATFDPKKDTREALAARLIAAGGIADEVHPAVQGLVSLRDQKVKVSVPNHDPNPVAFDALKQKWSDIKIPDGSNLFLNPEFSDIAPWAQMCDMSNSGGCAPILFLVPVSISDWFYEYVYGVAEVYLLHGRLSFDGVSPYPKDCMLCRWTGRPEHRRMSYGAGRPVKEAPITVWNWRKE